MGRKALHIPPWWTARPEICQRLVTWDDQAVHPIQLLLRPDLHGFHSWQGLQAGHMLPERTLQRQDTDAAVRWSVVHDDDVGLVTCYTTSPSDDRDWARWRRFSQ